MINTCYENTVRAMMKQSSNLLVDHWDSDIVDVLQLDAHEEPNN